MNENAEQEKSSICCQVESNCPVVCTMDIIGKKWHLVILHRLLDGSLRFSELSNEIDGVTNKVLSQSLEDLQEHGLVNRVVVSEKPVKVEYRLTETGKRLQPVIEVVESWGDNHFEFDETEGKAYLS